LGMVQWKYFLDYNHITISIYYFCNENKRGTFNIFLILCASSMLTRAKIYKVNFVYEVPRSFYIIGLFAR
jgi:hypothetical protein